MEVKKCQKCEKYFINVDTCTCGCQALVLTTEDYMFYAKNLKDHIYNTEILKKCLKRVIWETMYSYTDISILSDPSDHVYLSNELVQRITATDFKFTDDLVEFKVTFYSYRCGLIIGKGGRNINKVQEHINSKMAELFGDKLSINYNLVETKWDSEL